ncbi:MAG: TrbG/VirB9 family P-type conjugative transfer protein [Parvularculaceae bacterium]
MRRLLLAASVAGLAGCETAKFEAPLDPAPMKPAREIAFGADEPLREIVETARPYPLPGQLKPKEEPAPPPSLAPFERIDAANDRAKVEPDLDRFLNAVQVYPFMDGALYRLYAAPEQVTDIALEPGEILNSVSAGDTVRWIVGDTTSGGPSGERVHILVKPIAPDLKNKSCHHNGPSRLPP